MKVLYINFTEKVSGGETSLLYYLEELKKRIPPIVVSPKKGEFSDRLNALGIKNYTFRLNFLSKRNPVPFFISLFKLVKLIFKEHIHILHANGMTSNQLGAIAAKLTRRPIVLHLQNYVDREYYYKYFIYLSDKIIPVSDVMQESLRRYIKNDKKIFLLKHAVPILPLTKKTFFLHKEIGVDHSKKLVALISLIEERKGHEYFIRAAKLVPNACFLIIGESLFTDDSYKNKIKQLATELQSKNVFFLGYRRDIYDILKELDLLIAPLINEPLGVIALEASSVGLPIVGFNGGGLREIVVDGKTGFLVEEKNYQMLGEKINQLIKNEKLRKAMGENARQKIEKEFNIRINTDKLMRIYEELI